MASRQNPAPSQAAHATGDVSGKASRRFVYSFLVASLSGCLVVGGFNYIVNPLNYYPPRIVEPLAWGDQLEKLELMKTAPKAQVLILGSSRTMKLSPADVKAVTGKTAFNGGVSSSRPEEWYAMLRHAVEDLDWPVQEVILGVDMETLFYAGQPNEDLLSSPELRAFLPRQLALESLWERAKLLLSWDQLQLSKKALDKSMQPPAPAELTFDADGYLHYVGWERAVAEERFSLVTEYQMTNYEQRYAGAGNLDPMRTELLEQLLAVADAKGIRVRAFFTPFHPLVLAEMAELPSYQHVHAAMTTYAEQLTAKHPNVTIMDFTEVRAFRGDPDNFFDGVHYRQENARLILEQLYKN